MQHVSSNLSKIPYGGFSPVRLQTGLIRRCLRRLRRLISGQLRRLLPASVPRTVSGRGAGLPVHSGPEALGSASGYVVPSRQRLLWPHPSFWPTPDGLLLRRLVFASRRLAGRSLLSSANPSRRATSSTPADRAAKDDSTSARESLRPNARGSASARSHLNRNTWVVLTRLQNSLNAAARRVVCPSPTRTFTFELSFHGSPHENVEYDYAGKSSISRGWTFTSWIRSLAGCTATGGGEPGESIERAQSRTTKR